MPNRPLALVAATALLHAAAARAGAQDTVAHRLPPVVTVTRDVGRSALDLPFAITVSRPDSLRPGQPHVFPEQTFFLLPGVTLANRNNPSQDLRISIRGFGARSAFGVRSIRVLRDGMPLTPPTARPRSTISISNPSAPSRRSAGPPRRCMATHRAA